MKTLRYIGYHDKKKQHIECGLLQGTAVCGLDTWDMAIVRAKPILGYILCKHCKSYAQRLHKDVETL